MDNTSKEIIVVGEIGCGKSARYSVVGVVDTPEPPRESQFPRVEYNSKRYWELFWRKATNRLCVVCYLENNSSKKKELKPPSVTERIS